MRALGSALYPRLDKRFHRIVDGMTPDFNECERRIRLKEEGCKCTWLGWISLGCCRCTLVHSPKRLYTILNQQKKVYLLEYVSVYSLIFSGGNLNGILQENGNITIPSCCSLMHLLFSISLMASISRKQMLPSFTLVQFWNNSTDVSEMTPNLSPAKAELDHCLFVCLFALELGGRCATATT